MKNHYEVLSKEEIRMDAKGVVVPPGQGSVWNMAPGRSATLKLQSSGTADNVMMFEEAAPAGTVTNYGSGANGKVRSATLAC